MKTYNFIDAFVLVKCNGMSYCLQSILSAVPIEKRSAFIVLVPDQDCVKKIPDGFHSKVIPCSSFVFWSNIIVPFFIFSNRGRLTNLLFPANTSPFVLLGTYRVHVILHDIMFMRELSVSGWRQWLNHLYYKWNLYGTLRRCHKVFTVSEFSKNDILNSFSHQLSSSDIVVLDEAVKSFPTAKPIADLPTKFYLAVCLQDPRKNTELCIDGFIQHIKNEEQNSQGGDTPNLVLFGDKTKWTSIVDRYGDEPIFQRLVTFVGRVSDAELAYLYEKAYAFIFPSTYEGFGLPVLESMSFGTPVITTKFTSLPEVGGDAAIYLDEVSSSALVNALRYLDNSEVYTHHAALSLVNIKRYSWNKSAALLCSEFESYNHAKK